MSPPCRSSSLTAEQTSLVKKCSPERKLFSQFTCVQCGVLAKNQHKMVQKKANPIFDKSAGTYTTPSSTCATPERLSSEHDYDKRLKTWKEIVEERKSITQRIQRTTGKRAHDVLINGSTVVNQEKNMVKRVLDFSDRLNPLRFTTRRLLQMPEYYNPKTCLKVNELRETLPRSERENQANIEIVEMPAVAKKEQFGCTSLPSKKSAWMCSKVLEESIEKKCSDIVRVLEFYPDIEHLEVIGTRLMKEDHDELKLNSEMKLVKDDVFKPAIGRPSKCKCKVRFAENKKAPIVYGIKINEHSFVMGMPDDTPRIEIKTKFECYPFENVKKHVLHLENIGQKILNISLVERNYLPEVQTLQRSSVNEFIIDARPFRLLPGTKHEIVALYQPRNVSVVKQQWILKVNPKFFIHTSGDIVLKLCGRCRPPEEYLKKINGALRFKRRT